MTTKYAKSEKLVKMTPGIFFFTFHITFGVMDAWMSKILYYLMYM